MVNANFTINSQEIGQDYIIANDGDLITLQLTDTSGVTKVEWNFIGYFPNDIILPIITKTGIPSGSIASFIFPAESLEYSTEGTTLLIQCKVNNGRNLNGTTNQDYTTIGAIGAKNVAGFIPFALGESTEFGSHSIINRLNKILKYASHTSVVVSGYLGDIGYVNSDGYIISDVDLNWSSADSLLNINGDVNITGEISGATTIGSTYLTTTPREATFNFGANDIIIGDGYLKAQTELSTYIGSIRKLDLSSFSLYPYENNGLSLGAILNKWSNFFTNAATITTLTDCTTATISTLNINTGIYPDTDGGAVLGSTTKHFTNLYAESFNIDNTTVNSNTTCYITCDDGYYSILNLGSVGNTDNNVIYSFNSTTPSASFIRFRVDDDYALTLYDNILRPYSNNLLDLGASSFRWNNIYGTILNLNGAISGATTIGSTYLTTTPREATFNFGSNDVIVGDGYVKAQTSLQLYIENSSELSLNATQFYPTTDSHTSLGTTDLRWGNFFTDNATITTSNIDTLTVNGSIIPDTDGGANIGVSNNRFSSVYAGTFYASNVTVNSNTTCYIISDDGYYSRLYMGHSTNTDNNTIYSFNSSTPSASYIQFKVDDDTSMSLYDSTLRPYTNNLLDLGSSSYRWNNIYGTALNLNGAISGLTTIGSTYFTTTPREATFNFGSNDIIVGDGYLKAQTELQLYIGNSSELSLNATQFYPTTDSHTALGTTDLRWANFFTDAALITTLTYCTTATISTLNINTGIYPDTDGGAVIGATNNRFSNLYAESFNIDNTAVNSSTSVYITCDDGYYSILNLGSVGNTDNNVIYSFNSSAPAASFIRFKIDDTFILNLYQDNISPYINNVSDLGTSSYRWKTIYGTNLNIATGIYPDTDGGAVIGAENNRFSNVYSSSLYVDNTTANSNTSVYILTDDGYNAILNLGYSGNLANNAIYSYNSSIESASSILFKVDDSYTLGLYDSTLRPYTDDLLDLGSWSRRWKTVYATALNISKTLTGTIGNVTINKTAGRCILAAAAKTITVTNSFVDSNSIIICTLTTVDAVVSSVSVEAFYGYFIITGNGYANANIGINFIVIN